MAVRAVHIALRRMEESEGELMFKRYGGWSGRPKYGNKKVIVDGIEFDSKKEAKRYKELVDLQARGEIDDLQRQVKFVLIPVQREPDTIGAKGGVHKGKVLEREVAYIADFRYWDNKIDDYVVEDTKGIRTKDYIIKRKLMLWVHGIRVREI